MDLDDRATSIQSLVGDGQFTTARRAGKGGLVLQHPRSTRLTTTLGPQPFPTACDDTARTDPP